MGKLYDGDTVTVSGREYRVNFEVEPYPEMPWENCDGHGPVRESHKSHRYDYSDKKPGERPLNSAGHNEYQYYYDWAKAVEMAKRDGWNVAPYDAPNRVQRAVQADFDYLSGFIAGDWCYLMVTVTDVESEEYECLGMVESIGSHASETAYEIANTMSRQHAIDNRFVDAMSLGV